MPSDNGGPEPILTPVQWEALHAAARNSCGFHLHFIITKEA